MNLVATLPELRAYAQKQDDEREAFEAKLNATKEEVSFELSEQKTKIEQIQTTLRVVENLGGRVFSTTGSFSTIGSAQK